MNFNKFSLQKKNDSYYFFFPNITSVYHITTHQHKLTAQCCYFENRFIQSFTYGKITNKKCPTQLLIYNIIIEIEKRCISKAKSEK